MESAKYIPRSSLQFVPQKEHIFLSDSKGTTQRLIFTGLELTQEEQTHYDSFLQYCQE
jgi:hypothetical protein